ncbi:MAG: YlbF family regulator [bacterium]
MENSKEPAPEDLKIARKLAAQLAEKIQASSYYREVMEAHDNLEDSPESQQLLREYRQQVKQKAMSGGEDPEGKVEDLEAKIKKDKVAHNFVQSEQEWMDFIQTVFDTAGEELEFNLRQAAADNS